MGMICEQSPGALAVTVFPLLGTRPGGAPRHVDLKRAYNRVRLRQELPIAVVSPMQQLSAGPDRAVVVQERLRLIDDVTDRHRVAPSIAHT